MAVKFLQKLKAKRSRKEESKAKTLETPHSTSTDDTEPVEDPTTTTPTPTTTNNTNKYKGSVSKDGKPVISSVTVDYFRPSDVAGNPLKETGRGYRDTRAKSVPTARNSAYTGPPRYDWVDVVRNE